MAKVEYKSINIRDEGLAVIVNVDQIIRSYQAQGIQLTLRQIYYQFVARNLFPDDRRWTWTGTKWARDPGGTKNAEPNYKWLGSLISDGRLSGRLDWDAIEDRVRAPITPSEWSNVASLVDSAIRAYRLPRWSDQRCYVELVVEKDALASVLEPVAHDYHITLMVNRGYSSQSAMRDMALRFLAAAAEDKELHLLYLGDLDPSGEDMVRDVRDRLQLFMDTDGFNAPAVEKLAITIEQVRQYNPPPSPAKKGDSRTAAFVEKYGNDVWELDALDPPVLMRLARDAIEQYIVPNLYEAWKVREEKDKAELVRASKRIAKKRSED